MIHLFTRIVNARPTTRAEIKREKSPVLSSDRETAPCHSERSEESHRSTALPPPDERNFSRKKTPARAKARAGILTNYNLKFKYNYGLIVRRVVVGNFFTHFLLFEEQ